MSFTIEPRCEVLQEVLARLRANRVHLDRLLEGTRVDALTRRTFKAVKSPGRFRPSPPSELNPALVAEGLREESEHLQELVRRADGLDLGRIRLATPVSPLLRVTVDQAFRLLAYHEARHLAQAERALAAAGDPA